MCGGEQVLRQRKEKAQYILGSCFVSAVLGSHPTGPCTEKGPVHALIFCDHALKFSIILNKRPLFSFCIESCKW